MNQIKIENVESEKDIGVIFDNELEFYRQVVGTDGIHQQNNMALKEYSRTTWQFIFCFF